MHSQTFTIEKARVPIFGTIERVTCDVCGRVLVEGATLLEGISAAATDSTLRDHANRLHGVDVGADSIIDERAPK